MAFARSRVGDEVLKARAEGRKLDLDERYQIFMSEFAAKCEERESAIMKGVETGLERLQRISRMIGR